MRQEEDRLRLSEPLNQNQGSAGKKRQSEEHEAAEDNAF